MRLFELGAALDFGTIFRDDCPQPGATRPSVMPARNNNVQFIRRLVPLCLSIPSIGAILRLQKHAAPWIEHHGD